MDALKSLFAKKAAEGEPAFVTFVTAGYPTPADTVPIMLAMQAGGADIIELGVPFSDPIADGPAIQEANTVMIRSIRSFAAVSNSYRSPFSTMLTIHKFWVI